MSVHKRQQGSITVFAVLSMILVLGFLLTLLEGTRMIELKRVAQLRTDASVESAFANYNSVLWETYHLLGTELSEATEIINDCAGSGYSELEYGTNLLMLKLESVEPEGYTLMTDGNGSAYVKAVSSYMQNNILYETAKLLYNQFESIKNLLDSSDITGTEIDEAIESLEELENQPVGNAVTVGAVATAGSVTTDSKEEEGGLLDGIKRLQKTQLLELVVEDTTILSEKDFDISQSVSGRELSTGKNYEIADTDWMDRILLQQYLLTYFADYTNPKSGRALSYELEYLIAGKDNDIENLRTVVNELLLIREAANFVYLLSDEDKVLQAELLATLLAGATASIAVIKVVKIALLLSWAFAESVLDVRALLQGKKIPLIKNKELWTLALENINSISKEYMVAKESELGISYKTYLGILLLFQEDSRLAYRAMDVQEVTMQAKDGAVRMDEIVIRMKVTNTYACADVFNSLETINGKKGWDYQISVTSEYGYD